MFQVPAAKPGSKRPAAVAVAAAAAAPAAKKLKPAAAAAGTTLQQAAKAAKAAPAASAGAHCHLTSTSCILEAIHKNAVYGIISCPGRLLQDIRCSSTDSEPPCRFHAAICTCLDLRVHCLVLSLHLQGLCPRNAKCLLMPFENSSSCPAWYFEGLLQECCCHVAWHMPEKGF